MLVRCPRGEGIRLFSSDWQGEDQRSRLVASDGYERVRLRYFVGRASRQRSDAPFGWLAVFPKPSDQGQRYLGELTPEGFVQWDTMATLLNSNSSYFNARVRWTPPRIGKRNNSLCPLSYFSRSSPW